MQPHLFHNESSLLEQMVLNKEFALVRSTHTHTRTHACMQAHTHTHAHTQGHALLAAVYFIVPLFLCVLLISSLSVIAFSSRTWLLVIVISLSQQIKDVRRSTCWNSLNWLPSETGNVKTIHFIFHVVWILVYLTTAWIIRHTGVCLSCPMSHVFICGIHMLIPWGKEQGRYGLWKSCRCFAYVLVLFIKIHHQHWTTCPAERVC